MAKKNSIGTIYLFAAGTILFSLGWLMPSFPFFSYFGLAPFIAIAANNRKDKSVWTSLELILLGIAIAFFASTLFSINQLASTTLHAIFCSLPFLGYTFVRKQLGAGVSITTLILFWLSLEYLILKWHPVTPIFLADMLSLKASWTTWNSSTGYLGSTLWILVSNTLLYQAILTERKVNWIYLGLFGLSIIVPIIWSYSMDNHAIISREVMLSLYESEQSNNEAYANKGEFIARTSAWISVLILLFTLVKRKTSKR